MKEEIILSGYGGQGILFAGKLLATGGMQNNLHITVMPSYGAEVRGGTAHCHVILSDEPIASPVVEQPTIVIAMNGLAMNKFAPKTKAGGLLILNTSLIETRPARKDIEIFEISATQLAEKIGDVRAANTVMVGALLAKKPFFDLAQTEKALADFLAESERSSLLEVNAQALRAGYEHGKNGKNFPSPL